jgi:plasmid stabilization system protein ParE
MSEGLSIELSGLAAQHIRQLEMWWRVNRTKAPHAVDEELERAFRLIGTQPRIGARATDVELPNVRRIHLSRVRHYLYYRTHEVPQRIEVLAVWSDSRGDGPPI